MATTSTASSSTDGPEPERDAVGGTTTPAATAAGDTDPAAAATPEHDLVAGRRQFFRLFGRQAIQTVTQVAGVASVVSQMPTNAAAGLMGLGLTEPRQAPVVGTPRITPHPTSALSRSEPAPYRSPYRIEDGVVHLLDQRRLPETIEEQVCRRGSDIAFYIRAVAVSGGPLLAQLAAYGVAMTAREFAERTEGQRLTELRRVDRAIGVARAGCRMLTWSLQRMTAVVEAAGDDTSGAELADALWETADAIAADAQVDHAHIAQQVAALLPRPEDGPLRVLIHGDPGALTTGLVGTAINGLMLRVADGGTVHAWVTETRPYLEGARLASWELAHAGIEHTLLPDSAVASLLDTERIDAVLMGAEWIAENGDTANVVGSRTVAELAGRAASGPVPVVVCAPITTYDPATPDGSAIPRDLRPAQHLGTYLSGVRMGRMQGYNPGADVMPAAHIHAFVTEMGVLSPSDRIGLAAALDARRARRGVPTAARRPPASGAD